MPAVPWTTEAQRTLAKANLPIYDRAVKDGKKAIRRFFSTFTGEFFEAFPMREELVAKGDLGVHVLADNYDLTGPETKTFQDAMETRTKQIKTLFRYMHKKEFVPTVASTAEETKAGLTAAAKVFVTKQRRCHQRVETFYRLNKDWLDSLIQQEMEDVLAGRSNAGSQVDDDDDDGEGGELHQVAIENTNKAEATRRGWNLKVRKAVIQRHFDAASEDDKRAVSEAIIQEKEELDRAADLNLSGRALARDPELRAEALDGINTFIVDNAKMYWDYAAMATITVGVAPDPEQPDKLRTRIVAYGRDANGKVITDVDPTLAGKIAKQFRAWAKTSLFTPEQFASAAAEHKDALSKLKGDRGDDDEQQKDDSDIEEVTDPAKANQQGTKPVTASVLTNGKAQVPSKTAIPSQTIPVTPSSQKPHVAQHPSHRIIPAAALNPSPTPVAKGAAGGGKDSASSNAEVDDPGASASKSTHKEATKGGKSSGDDDEEDPDVDDEEEPVDPEYRDIQLSFGKPTKQHADEEGEGGAQGNTEGGDDVDADGEDVDADGEDVDADGEDVDADGEDVDADGEDVDADGEAKGDDDEEEPFDGTKFWAGLDTNIPNDAKGAAENVASSTKPKPNRKSKGRTQTTKSSKGKKSKDTATSDPVNPNDPGIAPAPVGPLNGNTATIVSPTNSTDNPNVDAPQKGKKRKVPTATVAIVEEGRPKRARNAKTLSDGTVYSGPSRTAKNDSAVDKVAKPKSTKGGKATGRKAKGK